MWYLLIYNIYILLFYKIVISVVCGEMDMIIFLFFKFSSPQKFIELLPFKRKVILHTNSVKDTTPETASKVIWAKQASVTEVVQMEWN